METISIDPTETKRRALLAQINSHPAERAMLESQHGQVWNVGELATEFEVLGFAAPLVVVRRRVDNRLGSLLFQHYPRFYFAFQEDQ